MTGGQFDGSFARLQEQLVPERLKSTLAVETGASKCASAACESLRARESQNLNKVLKLPDCTSYPLTDGVVLGIIEQMFESMEWRSADGNGRETKTAAGRCLVFHPDFCDRQWLSAHIRRDPGGGGSEQQVARSLLPARTGARRPHRAKGPQSTRPAPGMAGSGPVEGWRGINAWDPMNPLEAPGSGPGPMPVGSRGARAAWEGDA